MGVRGYRGYRNYRDYRKPMVVRAPHEAQPIASRSDGLRNTMRGPLLHEAFAIPLCYTLPPIEGRAWEGSFYFILVIARAARAYRPSTTVSMVCRVCTMRANTAASLSCTP